MMRPRGCSISVLALRLLDPQQHAIANAAGHGCVRVAGYLHENLRGTAPLFVPFSGNGDQFAVVIPTGDVGGQHRRKLASKMHSLAAAPPHHAIVGEVAQNALQFDPVGVLQAECAGDFAGAGFAGLRTDERDDVVPRREGGVSAAFSLHYRR